MLIKIG